MILESRIENFFNARCNDCSESKFSKPMVNDNLLIKHCNDCKTPISVQLPKLTKQVIYLDQFFWSNLYKLNNKPKADHKDFFDEADNLLKELVATQQIILPFSDIHEDETLVYGESCELRKFMLSYGGNIKFISTDDILALQINKSNASTQTNLVLDDVQKILKSDVNVWLPKITVISNPNMSILKEVTEGNRDCFHACLLKLYDGWAQNKPDFKKVLEEELAGYDKLVRNTPYAFIFSYLTAVLSQRAVNGMRKENVTKGTIQDFRAISTYLPYVDAMFVDKECANILGDDRLKSNLAYKSKVFSFSNKDCFIKYLNDLKENTSREIQVLAALIYNN